MAGDIPVPFLLDQLGSISLHPSLEAVSRAKNKVVIWRPFPSPTKREPVLRSVLSQSGLLKPQQRDSTAAKDDTTINRWVELADILNGKKTSTKTKKWAA